MERMILALDSVPLGALPCTWRCIGARRDERESTMDTPPGLDNDGLADIPASMVAAVGLTWSKLDDDEKTVLHLAATWPPDFIVREDLRPKVSAIIDKHGSMERSVAESVEILAAHWHKKAGRI